MDIEKVADLAKALNIKTNDLLTVENEVEDSKEMTNMITHNNIDYSTSKNTVRSTYSLMSNYIELFRMTLATDSDATSLKPIFMGIYASLMEARFDLPYDVFQRLCSFAVNYLQQMGCLLRFEECINDDEFFFTEENFDSPDNYYTTYSHAYECPPCAPWSDFLYVSVDPESAECKAFMNAAMEDYRCWDELSTIYNEILINTAYSMLETILEEYLVK